MRTDNGGYTDLTVHEQIAAKVQAVGKIVHELTQHMSRVDTTKLDGSIQAEDFAYLCGYVVQLSVASMSLMDATQQMKNDGTEPGLGDFLKGLHWPTN